MIPLAIGFLLGVSLPMIGQPPPKPDPPQEEKPDPVVVGRYRGLIALGVGVADAEDLAEDMRYVDVVHAIASLIARGASVTQAVRIVK